VQGDEVNASVIDEVPPRTGLPKVAIAFAAVRPGVVVFEENAMVGDEVGAVVLGKFPAEVVVAFFGCDQAGWNG
jgi:hypothetical protein